MSISGIELVRFRGFRRARLPLKKLTLLVGQNSSGKSSFSHALVGLHQAQQFPSSRGLPDLRRARGRLESEWPVDLGLFENLRTDDTIGAVEIGIETDAGKTVFAFGGENGEYGLELSGLTLPVDQSPLSTVVAGASVPSELYAKPIPHTIGISDPSMGVLSGRTPVALRRTHVDGWVDSENKPVRLVMQGLDLRLAWREGDAQSTVGVNAGALAHVAEAVRKATYLHPHRRSPSRQYPQDDRGEQGLGPFGEWTVDHLFKHGHDLVKTLRMPELPTDIETARAYLDQAPNSESVRLTEGVGYWLHRLGLAETANTFASDEGPYLFFEVRRKGGSRDRSLPDVGFGVSQVLPIIVAGLTLKEEGMLIVETPEAHLHPKAEAGLADFFSAMALLDRQIIVETHSAPLFHRLRAWSALNTELASRIGIWFFDASDRDGECRLPRELALTDEAALRWPDGFLDEGLDGELALRAARGARRSQGA